MKYQQLFFLNLAKISHHTRIACVHPFHVPSAKCMVLFPHLDHMANCMEQRIFICTLISYIQVVIAQFTFDEFSIWLAGCETSIRRVIPLHGCSHTVSV